MPFAGRRSSGRRDVADLVARGVLAFAPRERRGAAALLRWASVPAAALFSASVQYAAFPEPSIAPFVFFYFAIAVTSGLCGRGPGLACVLLCAAIGNYAFIPPRMVWSVDRPALVATGLFLLAGTLVAFVCASLRTALLRLDVTARELDRRADLQGRAEQALRESEARLRGIFDNAGIGIAEMDAQDRFVAVNDHMCELVGYPREELLRMTTHDLTAPADREVNREKYAQLHDGATERLIFDKRYVRRAGETVWVHVTVSARRDAKGAYTGAIGTVEDIHQRKDAEAERDRLLEALGEADRRKNEFLGMLSHELRNPLAPIRNSLFILGRAPPGGEQARRAIAVIDRQVQHTTRLVDDLLDVTRITRGKVRLQRERVDLVDLARQAAEDHRDLFARSGVRLELNLPGEPVILSADAVRVAQVVGNLLQNAAKFTPRGGSATLSVDRADAFARVTVRDTGAGIAPDVLARLFEPFVQADRTLDRSAGGLGLGLALVKGLAELHGGAATAHSEGVGKGATFTVTLPLERRKAPRLQVVPSLPSAGPARRVLVVEDDLDSAESLREALELSEHVVDVALSGAEGIEKARSLRPDVVLCDIGLPGMDGFQVAKAIRADPGLAAVGLIALTGYAQPEDLERSKDAGFDLHLAKPLHPDALERAIVEARQLAAARAASPAGGEPPSTAGVAREDGV